MSAVASDAILYSSSAHRSGSAAQRGKDTAGRAESSPFSEHLDSVRDTPIAGSGAETPAKPSSSKRDPSSEQAAAASAGSRAKAERTTNERTGTGRSPSADDDQIGAPAPATAGDEADPASSAAAQAATGDTTATAETAPVHGEDADKDTVNAITPADVLDDSPIDPAIGKPVTADSAVPAALAAAAAQARDATDADTAETGPSAKDGKDEKKVDPKTDTKTDTKTADSIEATAAAPANMVQIVVAAVDGAPPAPAGDAQPVKPEGGKATPIDLHPAIIAQAMPLKTSIDTTGPGKDAADPSAEDKAALQQTKTADADQPDGGASGNTKTAAATAPTHRQTTTDRNDISAIKPAIDADSSAHPTQNGGANPTTPVTAGTPVHQGTLATQSTVSNPMPAPAPAPPVPVAGLGIALAAKAMEGKNRFEIRLDPPELGKIEVRLEVHHNGEVTSRMIADRPDTLDLLRRDAAGLERALQDAGLKTNGNGLQFSLRDQGFAGHDQTPERAETAHIVVNDEIQSVSELSQRNYRPLTALRGGLDIRV